MFNFSGVDGGDVNVVCFFFLVFFFFSDSALFCDSALKGKTLHSAELLFIYNLPSEREEPEIIFSCIQDNDIRVFYLDQQFLSHPVPDKNHVYLMHRLYWKARICIVKWRWFLQPLRQKMTSLYAN